MRWLKNILPWLVAIGIFTYLFRQYPLGDVLMAIRHVHLFWFAVYAICYFAYIWYFDCWGLARIFGQFGAPTQPRELFRVRFASYLIMVVNYGAGQATLAYFLQKLRHIKAAKAFSVIIFVVIMDLYWAITLAFIGTLWSRPVVQGVALLPWVSLIWVIANTGLITAIAFWKWQAQHKYIRWVQQHPLLQAFALASFRQYGRALLYRLPLHLAINTALFFVALTFGVHIPFLRVLACFPIVILAGTIPITPGGLGTIQVATIELFQGSVSGGLLATGQIQAAELLLAMSLLIVFANYFLKAVTGSLFFHRIVRPKTDDAVSPSLPPEIPL